MAHNDNPGQWWLAEIQAEAVAAAELAAAGKPVPKKAEVEPASKDSIDAELDREDAERAAALKRLGADAAEIERHVGKAGEPKEAAPEPTLEETETALAELRALRTTDRKKYLSDEIQAEERRLIEVVEQAKAAQKLQAAGQATVDSILAEVDDAAALETSFTEAVSSMSEESADAVRTVIATPVDPVRVADAAALELFSSVPAQAELVAEWGKRDAPRRLAALKERTTAILKADPSLGHWLDAQSAATQKSILRALAR